MLETFSLVNNRLKLGAEAVATTRNETKKSPMNLAHLSNITWITGDFRRLSISGTFTHAIHAAAAHSSSPVMDQIDVAVNGTNAVLETVVWRGVKKLLLTSSGAVYGESSIEPSEFWRTAPLTTNANSTYGECKRMSELMCCACAKKHGFEAKIARMFAFHGPHLPLDKNFAIGNFIGDALAGRQVTVKGDGTPIRSYMYASDMAIWLWTILFKGTSCQPYNVGSNNAVSIETVAGCVAAESENRSVVTQQKLDEDKHPKRYVPDTTLARRDLQLKETVPIIEGIRRTLAWHRGESL